MAIWTYPIAVHRNDTKVQDGRRTRQDVKRMPHVTGSIWERRDIIKDRAHCLKMYSIRYLQALG